MPSLIYLILMTCSLLSVRGDQKSLFIQQLQLTYDVSQTLTLHEFLVNNKAVNATMSSDSSKVYIILPQDTVSLSGAGSVSWSAVFADRTLEGSFAPLYKPTNTYQTATTNATNKVLVHTTEKPHTTEATTRATTEEPQTIVEPVGATVSYLIIETLIQTTTVKKNSQAVVVAVIEGLIILAILIVCFYKFVFLAGRNRTAGAAYPTGHDNFGTSFDNNFGNGNGLNQRGMAMPSFRNEIRGERDEYGMTQISQPARVEFDHPTLAPPSSTASTAARTGVTITPATTTPAAASNPFRSEINNERPNDLINW